MFYLSAACFVAFFLSIATSILLLINNHKRTINIVWALLGFCVGMWSLGYYFTFSASNLETALLWSKLHNYFAFFIPPLYLHFVYLFLKKESKWVPTTYGVFSSLLIVSILKPTWLLKGVHSPEPFNYYDLGGPLFLVFFGLYSLVSTWGLWLLIQEYLQSDGDSKLKLKYIIASVGIGLIGGSTTFPLVFEVPVFPYGGPSPIIYVCIIGYAIAKLDLLGIPVIITRLASSSLVLGAMTIISWFSLTHISQGSPLFYLVNISLILVWILFYKDIQRFIQTAAEKKFLKGHYNVEEILHTLSTKLLYTYHYESVMSVIATEFLTQLELKNAFTFFLTDQNKFDLKQVGIENPIGSIAIESDFIEYFESQSDPIYLESIPEKAVADITNFKFEPDSLLFAIHSSKQLKGIFVLSPKLSEDTFSSSDMKLLDTITNQIMVVFDRIAKERELAHANSQLKDLNDNLEQKVQSQVKEIEEKRKIEKDLEMASTIQRSVLPKCSPKINNYSFHASFYPSRKIGGDYYNFFPFSENEIGILLCDVAGKGISSAIMMMELHSLVHRLVKPDLSPKDFMFQLNNAIVNNQIIKKQVATFYGVLNNETHALTYCNGGHDEGYLFTGTQCLPLAESSGLSPGFMEDQDYKNEMTSMKNGDALMVFTDGLTDVESPDHEKYGLDRVLDAAKAYRKSKGSFETLGQALVSEWQAFKADNNLQKDDMTLITIEHERLPLFVPNNEDL